MLKPTSKQELFDSFYKKYYKIIYNYSLSWGQSHSDADEIASEALLRLYRKWDERWKIPEEENLKWLYMTARNVIHEYSRAQARKSENEVEISDSSGGAGDVERQTVEEEQYSYYLGKIKKLLEPEEWRLFCLAFVEERSMAEIEAALGIDNTALRARLYRLRKKLKSRLDKIL